jgi:hypothetical protein
MADPQPAGALQIRNVAQGLLDTRIALAVAQNAFDTQEAIVQQAVITEAQALAASVLTYEQAVDAARTANPDWTLTKAARDSAALDDAILTEQLHSLVFDGQ